MMVAALVVGLLVWLPALLLVALIQKRWLTRWSRPPAAAAILALLMPGIANSQPGGGGVVLAAWAIALAPLLAFLGAIAHEALYMAMSNSRHSKYYERLSSMLLVVGCIAIGLLIHWILS